MNALIRWTPLGELADMHGRLSSILGRTTQNGAGAQAETASVPDWIPVVDIAENDGGYLLKIEIPGVREDQVAVNLDGRNLTVKGERTPEKGEGVRYLRVERAHGAFSRTFQLPENVDPDKVEARFRNGVLDIHVAKSEAAKPRVIAVRPD